MLERDARIGLVDLAAAVGVSLDTIQSRPRRLKAAGLGRAYTVAVNLSKVGFAVQALTALEIATLKMASWRQGPVGWILHEVMPTSPAG